MEMLPGARFRIPVQNPAGAWGSGLVGRSSWFPDIRVVHSLSGAWALGFQPWNRRRPEKSALSIRGGITEKEFLFFQKRLLGY